AATRGIGSPTRSTKPPIVIASGSGLPSGRPACGGRLCAKVISARRVRGGLPIRAWTKLVVPIDNPNGPVIVHLGSTTVFGAAYHNRDQAAVARDTPSRNIRPCWEFPERQCDCRKTTWSSSGGERRALGDPRDVVGDRRRLVLLQEVLGGNGFDLAEAHRLARRLAVGGDLERRVVGRPEDLHGVGHVVERAAMQGLFVGVGFGGAHDFTQ